MTTSFWSFGIEQVKARKLCGDLIISGHTLIICTAVLTFKEYTPRRTIFVLIGKFYQALALIAICSILMARKHYTIDVVLAYWLATRTFWAYHSLQHSLSRGELKRNRMNQVCWGWLVSLLEEDE